MIIQPDYMTVRPNPTAGTMDWAINESKSKGFGLAIRSVPRPQCREQAS